MTTQPPHVIFKVRTEVTDDSGESVGHHYDTVFQATPNGLCWLSDHLPAQGDTVFLYDRVEDPEPRPWMRGFFRVAERIWRWAAFGSDDWPAGQDHALTGPTVEVVVDRLPLPVFHDAIERPHTHDGEEPHSHG